MSSNAGGRGKRQAGFAEAGDLFAGEVPPPPGHLGHRARMRERLLRAGPDALLDHEMLEMLLFTAMPRRDTKPIARALLDRLGSFADTIAAPMAALQEVEGMGEAGAAALKLVQGAALRLSAASIKSQNLLNNWERLLEHLTPDVVHVLVDGRIVETGGPELAERLESGGFDSWK
jgi:DNA repair protein RadC